MTNYVVRITRTSMKLRIGHELNILSEDLDFEQEVNMVMLQFVFSFCRTYFRVDSNQIKINERDHCHHW